MRRVEDGGWPHAGIAGIGNLALVGLQTGLNSTFLLVCRSLIDSMPRSEKCSDAPKPEIDPNMNKSILMLLSAALLFSLTPVHAAGGGKGKKSDDAAAGDPVMRTVGALGAQGVFSTYMAIAEV